MESLLNKINKPEILPNNSKNTVISNDSAELSKRDYKSYPQDFINQVVGVYKSGVYENVADCAKAYGISNKSLYRWLRAVDVKSTPKAISEQQAEMTKLKKELAKAKMENEILKKAAIYFANQAQ
jgi:transposase